MGKLPFSFLITLAQKRNIKSRSWMEQYEMAVTYNCWEVMYSNRGNKGFCQNPVLSHQCVCEILSALMCACQAASLSMWITLMKGERGNNQRSQYFTLDTDACSYAAGRRDLLAAQLISDLTLGFNATFLSPAQSSRFLSHSLGAPAPHPPPPQPRLPLSTQPACLTAAKG